MTPGGTYKLTDLPAGIYRLEGHKEGVGSDMVFPVELAPGETKVVDLFLE